MDMVDEPVSYYDDLSAALGLSAALKDLDEIEAEKRRWEWSMPPYEEQRRDRAVARVKAAVRHLCSDEADA